MIVFYGYMADIEEVSRMGNEREDAPILLQTVGSKVRKSPSIQKYPKTSPKEEKKAVFFCFVFTNTRGLLPLAKSGSVYLTNYSKRQTNSNTITHCFTWGNVSSMRSI